MTGPKLNEKSFVAGERSGTKASAKYVRMSASKVRAVLDLIRGLPVRNADEVLQFTDKEAAVAVRKVLASAVANAVHNDEQDADELYVRACFADEGPTLKRFTPRARGRAGRINKRTAHITVIVESRPPRGARAVESSRSRRAQGSKAAAGTGPAPAKAPTKKAPAAKKAPAEKAEKAVKKAPAKKAAAKEEAKEGSE